MNNIDQYPLCINFSPFLYTQTEVDGYDVYIVGMDKDSWYHGFITIKIGDKDHMPAMWDSNGRYIGYRYGHAYDICFDGRE